MHSAVLAQLSCHSVSLKSFGMQMKYIYNTILSPSMLCPLFTPVTIHVCHCYDYMGTVRPKSKQSNTTILNISFPMENEKRAAQAGFEPTALALLTAYCLREDALPTEL